MDEIREPSDEEHWEFHQLAHLYGLALDRMRRGTVSASDVDRTVRAARFGDEALVSFDMGLVDHAFARLEEVRKLVETYLTSRRPDSAS